ncbi:uncharacterized protein K444DRAFT_618526 [Hyaloscypha bicolor E]|uniref:C2H2-type domain-containing protein n=1 Tax=Hyaloscypha bicolor E TaxID=1095630 RepID=A0A2J6STJ1_9HELO|nr:uncharacterized protein K444DRAFT_618526 [Hyaloscypha bicolor E]PMD54062.1 hypothetical protein K444DRAFT_618526 [Hyaloscypha bicolor E]
MFLIPIVLHLCTCGCNRGSNSYFILGNSVRLHTRTKHYNNTPYLASSRPTTRSLEKQFSDYTNYHNSGEKRLSKPKAAFPAHPPGLFGLHGGCNNDRGSARSTVSIALRRSDRYVKLRSDRRCDKDFDLDPGFWHSRPYTGHHPAHGRDYDLKQIAWPFSDVVRTRPVCCEHQPRMHPRRRQYHYSRDPLIPYYSPNRIRDLNCKHLFHGDFGITSTLDNSNERIVQDQDSELVACLQLFL